MTAFQIGDRVGWPSYDGWHYGNVLARRPCHVADGYGHSDSLEITVRDEWSGRITTRKIRDCCALIPGQHLQRADDAVRVA